MKSLKDTAKNENYFLTALWIGFVMGLGGGWIWKFIFRIVVKGLIRLRDWHTRFDTMWVERDMGARLDYALFTILIILVMYAAIRAILETMRRFYDKAA